eukprot:3677000-Ditylum_brightwellii.AAC.1
MHISVYGKQNRTVESLWQTFTNLHQTRAQSGDLSMSEEIREAKLVWLQIKAKLECSTGSSDDNSVFAEEKGDDNDDNEDTKWQDLLVPNMAQMIGMMSAKKTAKKSVIELVDEESNSESDSSDSAFVKRPDKKAKTGGKVTRKAKKSVEKQVE